MAKPRNRLVELTLDQASLAEHGPEVQHERAVAIHDLLEQNSFAVDGHRGGPYRLQLSVSENRLRFDIRSDGGAKVRDVILSLTPFRGIVRDYFVMLDSYFDAIKKLSPAQIEAIDMGRRALHNDGAELVQSRLNPRVVVDETTARRLFTLICVLHIRRGSK